MAPQEMPYLACVRHIRGLPLPLLSGRIFSSRTRQSSKLSSDVIEARKLSLCLVSRVLNPFVPFSTINPRISSLSVFAHTMARSATEPFVIQDFAPFSNQPSPTL